LLDPVYKHQPVVLSHLCGVAGLGYSATASPNQPLVLTKPTVAMRLVSDDEAANPTRPGRFTAITIRLEEAL